MSAKLFSVRNAFYLGNFQTCINEAQRDKTQSLEKDLFMYRSYICLKKYGVVMDELKNKNDVELIALRRLATYFSGDSKTRNRVMEELESSPPVFSEEGKVVHLIAAAQIALNEDKWDTALRFLSGASGLEVHALTLQIYLKLDRIDLARKELKKMQEKDEDSTLTQLSQAWINLSYGLGKDKLEEAYYIFHDLSDKYGSSPLLLNGQVSALLAQHKFDAAEPLLHESLEKDSDNPETLINLMVLSSFLSRGQDVVNRYWNQLKDGNSDHPFVLHMEKKEQLLDNLIRQNSVQ